MKNIQRQGCLLPNTFWEWVQGTMDLTRTCLEILFRYYQNKIISYTFDLKSQQVYNTLQNQIKESIKLIHLV